MPLSTPIKPPDETSSAALPPSYPLYAWRLARRLSVFVLGCSVVLAGIVMIVTPGPAVVVIPLGLGILATEFLWARRILNQIRHRLVAGQEMLPDSRLSRWLKRWLVEKPPGA